MAEKTTPGFLQTINPMLENSQLDDAGWESVYYWYSKLNVDVKEFALSEVFNSRLNQAYDMNVNELCDTPDLTWFFENLDQSQSLDQLLLLEFLSGPVPEEFSENFDKTQKRLYFQSKTSQIYRYSASRKKLKDSFDTI